MAEVTVNVIKSIFTGETKSLVQSTKDAESALAGFMKSLNKSSNFAGKIGKILEYRLVRGGISKIMQGLEDGKKAIEAYDKALNGLSASKASLLMQEMRENTTLLQNTLASLFMTVYASVQPAINQIVEMLRDAMNAVNQFISALMGRTSYTKAVKGINNVTNSVKALKKQIFGFDELNILNAPNGNSGEDYSKNFEEVEIEGIFAKIAEAAQKLQSVINFDDWQKAAAIVGATIAGWKVGSTLLSFINALKDNQIFQFAVGVTLVVAGFEGLKDAMQKAITEGLSPQTLAQMLISSGAIILGGALVGKVLGDAVLGGAIGALVAGGAMLWTGIHSALQDGLSPTSAFLIMAGTAIIGTVFGMLNPAIGLAMGGVTGLVLGGLVALGILIYQHWDDIVTWIKHAWDAFKIKIATAKDWVVDTVKALVDKVKQLIQPALDLFNQFKDAYNTAKSRIDSSQHIFEYANGGYPSTGDLFIANESGPELVGSFGNRTGVYNQEQFAGAMAAANQQVVQAVLAIGSQITGAVNSKPVPSVKIGDRDIFNASQRGANLVGNSLIQGGRS